MECNYSNYACGYVEPLTDSRNKKSGTVTRTGILYDSKSNERKAIRKIIEYGENSPLKQLGIDFNSSKYKFWCKIWLWKSEL